MSRWVVPSDHIVSLVPVGREVAKGRKMTLKKLQIAAYLCQRLTRPGSSSFPEHKSPGSPAQGWKGWAGLLILIGWEQPWQGWGTWPAGISTVGPAAWAAGALQLSTSHRTLLQEDELQKDL